MPPQEFDFFGELGEEEEAIEDLDKAYQIPVEKHSSHYWRTLAQDSGKACVLWFSNPESLVSHLLDNTPPNKRDVPFKMLRILITNVPEVKDIYDPEVGVKKDWFDGDWYNFKEIDHGKWILRGTMTQWNLLFPEPNRGKQSIANCFTALAYAYMFALQRFQSRTINDILKYGDRLYTFTKRLRRKELLEDPELGLDESQVQAIVDDELFSVEDIFKNFCIDLDEVMVELKPEYITGETNAQDYIEILDVKRGIEKFFRNNRFGILSAKDQHVAIWQGNRMMYMFDANARGPNGIKEFNGVACITRYNKVDDMADVFLKNLPKTGNNFFAIHKVSLSRVPCPRIRKVEEEKQPDVINITGFVNILPGKYILRGTLSADDPKFGRGTNKFPEPVAIVALAMSCIHRSAQWSSPIVDDVLVNGDNLYASTLDVLGFEFNPWEQKLDLKMIPSDFNMGTLKVNFEVRNNDQKGIIDIKNPNILNVRRGELYYFSFFLLS